nr:phosphoribosyltransferase [Thermoflexibacter sp.]
MENIKKGDIVYLNSNPSVLTTVSLVLDDIVCIQWIDEFKKERSITTCPEALTLATPEHVEKINSRAENGEKTQNFELLYCDKLNVYGLKIYASLIASFTHDQPKELEHETRFTYDFKKYMKHANTIKSMITAVANRFSCRCIVAIPPHTTEPNSLQKLFGNLITRTTEVLPRKYNHKKPLPNDYGTSYHINLEAIPQGKILLVDDILTSGATINHFAQIFEGKGYEVVKFCIGIDKKLT